MSVLETMLKIRQGLLEKEHARAMEVTTEMLYHKVDPRVTDGDSFTLFKDENIVMAKVLDVCRCGLTVREARGEISRLLDRSLTEEGDGQQNFLDRFPETPK